MEQRAEDKFEKEVHIVKAKPPSKMTPDEQEAESEKEAHQKVIAEKVA